VSALAVRGPGFVLVESVATGLACAGVLVWLGSCLVGSFRPDQLAGPYWPEMGGLRTDTSGVLAFSVTLVTLAVSETMRVVRRSTAEARPDPKTEPAPLGALLATGIAVSVLVVSVGLVVYLSVNAVTHPESLSIRATHFISFPTEGTLRMLALVGVAASAGWLRGASISYPGIWLGRTSSRRGDA
jgi:hypothetical protein